MFIDDKGSSTALYSGSKASLVQKVPGYAILYVLTAIGGGPKLRLSVTFWSAQP